MRRFLTAATVLLAIVLGSYYAVYYNGFYLHLGEREEALDIPFRTEGPQLQRRDGQGYTGLTLRGVDVSASFPGHYATSYDAEEGDYLRWLEAIGEMGANAVRVTSVMDDDFYNALYAYNISHDSPLYLLQGTNISYEVGNGAEDSYTEEFMGMLLKNGKSLIDIIHGQKNLPGVGIQSGGVYRRDISTWVAGILIGTEWYPDTISYTDHNTVRSGIYEGSYFRTAEGASPFEAAMAQIMDGITAYETDKYHEQRPIGFLCDPSCDFLEYEEVYARQLQKHARVDPEHVVPQPAMKAGNFAAYRLFDFCDSFAERLSAGQRQAIAPLLVGLPTDQPYGGYLELLSRYHTMPVVAAGYGFSSSRGALVQDRPPLREREQGEHLAEVSRVLEDDGWAGGFISTWQDTWERYSWNTIFAAVHTENYMWHDLQTDGQGYGLMAFAPGEEPVCVLDGDAAEWSGQDLLLERDSLRLSARYDAEGLYLLLEGADPETAVYLPLDISPEVGSRRSDRPPLAFQRDADFLLCINGRENSRLLVQERCDPLRERFLYETTGDDPFLSFPEKDSGAFIPLYMVVRNPLLVDILNPETRALQRLGMWETGRLVHGNGDSEAANYNSLADFCFGENCVEIRLPWLLLNVGDPSSMLVHRDYYQHYGVEFLQIQRLWIGVSRGGERDKIPMSALKLKGWKTVDYRERLKESYYIMQKCWEGGYRDEAAGS